MPLAYSRGFRTRGVLNLNRLAYFTAVVDTGSFTAAADHLGITKAVVGQHVARLEAEVGVTLLIRTTRKVRPTDAGLAFHARCKSILGQAGEAVDELGQVRSSPAGTLKIAAPLDCGIAQLAPLATAFSRKYPACRTKLSLGDRAVDLVFGDFDMAIRIGWLTDSSHQARKIGSFRQLLVCAPSLAGSVASCDRPGDLLSLPFVANEALVNPHVWRFMRRGRERQTVRWQPGMSIDATMAVQAAVLSGAGLSVLPDFLVATDILEGRLIHVLPDWELPSGGIHVVFPAARFRPSKVTRFVEMLVAAERSPRGGAYD